MVQVRMADGSSYDVNNLLSKGETNAKLAKSQRSGKGYYTAGLSLSPAKESGFEMCASRSPGCTKACLFTAGHGVYASVRNARIAKTRLFHQKRDVFLEMLRNDLAFYLRRANKRKLTLACRLNIVSDVMWEKVFPTLFTEFAEVQFYDYTKHFQRMLRYDSGDFPANYHLTFSRSETNHKEVCHLIQNAKRSNIAVVFDSKDMPATYLGWDVIYGDDDDLRFTNPPRTIIGLYAKGRGRKDKSGFVVH